MKVKQIRLVEGYQDAVCNLRIHSEDGKNHNYIANGVCVSNCHHASGSKVIKKIIEQSENSRFTIGVTGTMPIDTTIGYMYCQSHIGPLVYKYTANQLINEDKRGTPIYVIRDILNWATNDEKKTMWLLRSNKDPEDPQAGTKCLQDEQKFVNDSYKRMKYICDLVIASKKNSLVLFGDVKYEYGKNICEYIRANSNKQVFYIDGEIPNATREYYIKCMDKDTEGNTVIVGSIYTMGEGVDIGNLWNIMLVNTAKANRIIRQICGRGIRSYPGKERTLLFDFIDDLRYAERSESGKYDSRFYENYMWKHGKEREQIYKSQNFVVYDRKTTIT